jgi:hypothetical protein
LANGTANTARGMKNIDDNVERNARKITEKKDKKSK